MFNNLNENEFKEILVENEDIAGENNIKSYSLKIKEIEECFFNNNRVLINIKFSPDINFIEPLFLIYISNLISRIEIRNVEEKFFNVVFRLDISEIEKKSTSNYSYQNYILMFLSQFIDTNRFVLKYKDEDKRDKALDYLYNKYNVYIKYNTVMKFNTKIRDNFLPILQISDNYGFKFNNIFETSDIELNEEKRKLYTSLSLSTKNDYNLAANIKDTLSNIFTEKMLIVNSDNKNKEFLLNHLSSLFFEAIYNIKKHTKDSLGYISFHNSKSFKNENIKEIIISDNYEDGFLETYKFTLIEELERIINLEIDRNDNIKYKNALKSIINSDNNIIFLKQNINIIIEKIKDVINQYEKVKNL